MVSATFLKKPATAVRPRNVPPVGIVFDSGLLTHSTLSARPFRMVSISPRPNASYIPLTISVLVIQFCPLGNKYDRRWFPDVSLRDPFSIQRVQARLFRRSRMHHHAVS